MVPRSTSTSIIVAGLLLAVALGAWWWSRPATTDAALPAENPSGTRVPTPSELLSENAAATRSAQATLPGNVAAPAEARPAAPSAVTPPVPPAGVRSAARPLSPEGERRVEEFLAGLRTSSSNAKEYETLGRSEPADPDWSPRLETLIQQVIERHAHEFGRLEISHPRCSRSLCMLTAVTSSRNPQHVGRTDYQRLVGYMMQEPWFRESFFDASTTMAVDTTGTVYVSHFIRK